MYDLANLGCFGMSFILTNLFIYLFLYRRYQLTCYEIIYKIIGPKII